MTTFNAFWVEKEDKKIDHRVVERSVDDLPSGEILIKVKYSSLNYKDALSAKGMPGVTRNYPHTPGIDAAGIVEESNTENFKKGDSVIVVGFDLGMNTSGGFGEYVRVPSDWVSPLPSGMSLRDSMILGTAGLTAALCYGKLLSMGAKPGDGPVLVTGATGGVGSVAVSLLSNQGFEVIAATGKDQSHKYLTGLGARSVISREDLEQEDSRPMGSPKFAHAVDTVGGRILTNVLKSLSYGGSAAICGLVASPSFDVTVFPFILRNINILGIDSVELPDAQLSN